MGSTIGGKPLTGTTYTANAAFGSGTDLGSGQYVVYNGPATGSVQVTGLANGTQYAFGVFTTNGAGYSNGVLRTVTPVVPATLTEVLVPQFISARTSSSAHTTRLPYVWRATISGLTASTAYKYYTAARATTTEVAGFGGVGVPIEVKTAGSFARGTGPNFGLGSTFTTDASGSYTGWFGVEPTADARFTDGSTLFPMVVLNAGDGGSVATQFLPTTSAVTARLLGSGSTQATAVRGSSFGTASNFVLTYDNTAGTGRPLAGTFIESDGSANTTANNYASFYDTSVNGVPSAYGLLTPNDKRHSAPGAAGPGRWQPGGLRRHRCRRQLAWRGQYCESYRWHHHPAGAHQRRHALRRPHRAGQFYGQRQHRHFGHHQRHQLPRRPPAQCQL